MRVAKFNSNGFIIDVPNQLFRDRERAAANQILSNGLCTAASRQNDVIIQPLRQLRNVFRAGDAVCIQHPSEFVTVEEKLDTAITMTELLYGQGVSDVRVDLVEYAKQFVGNPYVWGGTSLTKGADCSGFVLAVFKKYGIALSHSSRAQANEGTKISASDLKPGDLIFYGNGKGNINHVAIYIGGGQVIHASSPKTGIKISSYKYRTPVKCVRVIQD